MYNIESLILSVMFVYPIALPMYNLSLYIEYHVTIHVEHKEATLYYKLICYEYCLPNFQGTDV